MPAPHSQRAHWQPFVRAQYKLSDARIRSRPAVGTLTVDQITRMEVPAVSSFQHDALTWWSSKEAAAENQEVKSLWRRVDKAALPDKTVAPEFPSTKGSRMGWEAFDQEFVDSYNDGSVPPEHLLLGRWQEEMGDVRIYPGLTRIARQQRARDFVGINRYAVHSDRVNVLQEKRAGGR